VAHHVPNGLGSEIRAKQAFIGNLPRVLGDHFVGSRIGVRGTNGGGAGSYRGGGGSGSLIALALAYTSAFSFSGDGGYGR
jgi:hypothetical protein